MSCGCGCNGTVDHVEAGAFYTHIGTAIATPGVNGGQTLPLDTRGADLIVAHVSHNALAAAPVLADSEGNTWTQLAALSGTAFGHHTWYAKNAHVGANHVFSATGPASWTGIIVHAFSGSDRTDPLQVTTGATTPNGTTLKPGAVTPLLPGSLVVAWTSAKAFCEGFTPSACVHGVSEGMTYSAAAGALNTTVAARTGFLIQPAPALIDPVFYWPTAQEAQSGIAVFKPATTASSVPVPGPKGLTARDLITATLKSIRVLGIGDPLPAEDANDALDRLNDWLDALALERLTMYFVTRTCKKLGSGVGCYTIGLNGDIGIARPTHIEAANLIQNVNDPVPFEKPIDIWTDQRWQGCRQKTLTSTYPTALYYDHNWQEGLGKIHVWPIPTDCGLTQLVLYTPVALSEFATLDTEYTFPPGYRRFIRTNFAAEIASEYGKQLTADQVMAAKQAKAQIKRGNVRPAELRVDAALIRGFDYFDWRTGEPR